MIKIPPSSKRVGGGSNLEIDVQLRSKQSAIVSRLRHYESPQMENEMTYSV